MAEITQIHYLTVSVGWMSGHSLNQLILYSESLNGQNQDVIRTELLSRSSGNESTFNLIKVVVRIQFHVGPRSLFSSAVWGCSQFLEANNILGLQPPTSSFKASKSRVNVSQASTL